MKQLKIASIVLFAALPLTAHAIGMGNFPITVPTLGIWGLIGLAAVLTGLGVRHLRSRKDD